MADSICEVEYNVASNATTYPMMLSPVRKIVNRGHIELQKIDEKENLADPFTKALRIKEFDDFKWKMGIRYCPDWL